MSRRAFLGFLTSAIGVTIAVNVIGCTTEPAAEPADKTVALSRAWPSRQPIALHQPSRRIMVTPLR
jgi:hypothetical protein